MNEDLIKKIMSRNPPKVLNKAECYELYEAGIFGNKALTWNSYKDILESGWAGGVCMRSKKGVVRKEVRYNLQLEEVLEHIGDFERLGISENMIGFNQSMPDPHLLLQGEVMRYQNGFWLLYTEIKKPMNQALAERKDELSGIAASKKLIHRLTSESYDDLERLLEVFPTSVVEFSTYSIPVGNFAYLNRNTVIWEVRNY